MHFKQHLNWQASTFHVLRSSFFLYRLPSPSYFIRASHFFFLLQITYIVYKRSFSSSPITSFIFTYPGPLYSSSFYKELSLLILNLLKNIIHNIYHLLRLLVTSLFLQSRPFLSLWSNSGKLLPHKKGVNLSKTTFHIRLSCKTSREDFVF